jgi:uncharacterized hydrophobic protein (TIGR00271 family)
VLRLSLSVHPDRARGVAEALDRTGGVRRLVRAPGEIASEEVVLSADVTPAGADEVMTVLRDLEVPDDDFLLARIEVVAPSSVARGRQVDAASFAWVEVMGEARAHSRPLGRYLALMTVAGVVAALGVIKSNSILIVGAMAVSPDLLPICSTCVGIVGRRWRLTRLAFGTLTIGLLLVMVVAAAVTALLDLTGLLESGFKVGQGGIGPLVSTDYSTVLVALAAGVAAMLSFETRASAAVGVAISVTTIPASAYVGVGLGSGELGSADGAAVVLVINVVLLIVSGSLTLLAQTRLAAGAASRAGRAREARLR